ncbi:hypothetical protein EW053_30460 [Streptomyces sp. IB2014 016-6]|nr:hypothetical protein EW053_30460 [Streptomyces sp. IB2014 016-6]
MRWPGFLEPPSAGSRERQSERFVTGQPSYSILVHGIEERGPLTGSEVCRCGVGVSGNELRPGCLGG